MATLRRATSTPDIMASQNSTVHQSSHEDTSVKFRRTRRCAGCHEPHEHHSWGQPGPHCQGRDEESEGEVEDDADHGGEDQTSFTTLRDADFGLASAMNPSMPQTGAPTGPDDSERLALEAKLRQLALEERRLADLDSLRRKVADKEASVLKMRQRQKQVAQQQQHKQQGQTITSGLSAAQQLPKKCGKSSSSLVASWLWASIISTRSCPACWSCGDVIACSTTWSAMATYPESNNHRSSCEWRHDRRQPTSFLA